MTSYGRLTVENWTSIRCPCAIWEREKLLLENVLLKDMFGYALRHPKLPASNGIVNKAGLTPLTLACKLGELL